MEVKGTNMNEISSDFNLNVFSIYVFYSFISNCFKQLSYVFLSFLLAGKLLQRLYCGIGTIITITDYM